MKNIVRFLLISTCFLTVYNSSAQINAPELNIILQSNDHAALPDATVELWRNENQLVKAQASDSAGRASFSHLGKGSYQIRISKIGFASLEKAIVLDQDSSYTHLMILQAVDQQIQGITVTARKPFVELRPDRTIVNVEAGITNAGTNALEALEKMPGISVDKDGNISLKGKANVLIMIDGKPTYVSGAELSSLLQGMNAGQISQVEIMPNPPAQYDAAGNAGIINIRLKKIQQRGFNGTLNLSYGQGRYPKSNDNLQLNYRSGKMNVFLNYGINANKNFTDIYAYRTYFKDGAVTSYLDQPNMITGTTYTHTLRAGIDYSVNQKTTLGMALTGLRLTKENVTEGNAYWMNAAKQSDSAIQTHAHSEGGWKNGGVNFNLRHSLNSKQEITADFDIIGYMNSSRQYYENNFPQQYTEAFLGNLPSNINIISGKADYHNQLTGNTTFDGGWKSSRTTTDNTADYTYMDAGLWKPDFEKTNHFIYKAQIHAAYATLNTNINKWTLQGGLRYEMTHYDANQLGNAMRKDSSFSKQYNSLFPNTFISYALNNNNSFSISAGRRIDRPAFQKLNPFVFIINKYAYMQGNPYYRPQYSWNFELSHTYKQLLVTTLSYSVTKDYFSQIFYSDTTTGIIIYSEGNLRRLRVLGLSTSLQWAPAIWWSISAQATLSHKNLEGVINKLLQSSFTQASFNLNQQFRFNKGWGAELTGFYNTRSQYDIQEVIYPQGQLSAGISKSIWKNKGTVKCNIRDILYTQANEGFTQFDNATEYFKIKRDSRVATLSLTWRFGKPIKGAPKRSTGSASEEIKRVGQ